MSEYQYYEFRAIDHPLTETQKPRNQGFQRFPVGLMSLRIWPLLFTTMEISVEILNNS